ncbi:unnamed protein product [Clonostachys chloroleuca]|uniref:Uncharacterized protein n=1 Tax=Clonostachys chloroleuca TaxID=1926264 RepID=A0AA35QG46_9HYPO|nr:unnamed protein product [Clonostachys chloroleuca]
MQPPTLSIGLDVGVIGSVQKSTFGIQSIEKLRLLLHECKAIKLDIMSACLGDLSRCRKLYELALEVLGKPNIGKESITTVSRVFLLQTDNIKGLLKMGLNYSNISSRCQDVHVGLESYG